MNKLPANLTASIPEEHRRNLLTITQKLKRKGYECFLVGGSVRDLIMGRIPKEYDLTTNATPDVVKSLFPRVYETGIQHGTVTVLLGKYHYEVTTYRAEYGYSDGRRPDKVEFKVNLEEDLSRRDFTVNAICLDIEKDELIDYHNGIEDIKNKIIRCIGDPLQRFHEDGLRPIRAIRFSCTLGFSIDEKTISAFLPTIEITAKISVERFQMELEKILNSSQPEKGIYLLAKFKYLSLFISYPISKKPKEQILPLFHQLRNKNFFELSSLPWFFFVWIWYSDSPLQMKKNPIRDLKLSNSIERDVIFFLNLVQSFESILQSLNEFDLLDKILSPMSDYGKKYYSLDKLLEVFADNIFPYLELNEKKVSQRLYELKEYPLIVSDLTIDGNWLKKNFPYYDPKSYGFIFKNILHAIWNKKLTNQPGAIFEYLQSKITITNST